MEIVIYLYTFTFEEMEIDVYKVIGKTLYYLENNTTGEIKKRSEISWI